MGDRCGCGHEIREGFKQVVRGWVAAVKCDHELSRKVEMEAVDNGGSECGVFGTWRSPDVVYEQTIHETAGSISG